MTRHAFSLLFALSFATLPACKGKEQGVRESFSAKYTCPEERIELRRREDVTLGQLRPDAPPPKDVAADPQRLALWRAKEEASRKSVDDACEMWEARGCGQQTLLCCRRPPKRMQRYTCFTQEYAAGVSKW